MECFKDLPILSPWLISFRTEYIKFFTLNGIFQNRPKNCLILKYILNEISRQGLSKMAQSGHTVESTLKSTKRQ